MHLALLLAAPAWAAPVLDQHNATNETGQSLFDQPWAQTFTAGRTGLLTSVALPLSTESFDFEGTATVDSVTVSIYDTTAGTAHISNGDDYHLTGTRLLPTGTAKASDTVDGAALPAFSYTPASTSFAFSNPPVVVAGHTYAMVVESTVTGEATVDWAISETTDVDSYAGGTMLFQSGADWYDYGYQPYIDSSGRIAYIDGAFDTYVQPCAILIQLGNLTICL